MTRQNLERPAAAATADTAELASGHDAGPSCRDLTPGPAPAAARRPVPAELARSLSPEPSRLGHLTLETDTVSKIFDDAYGALPAD